VAVHAAVAERGVRTAEAQGAAVAALLALLAVLFEPFCTTKSKGTGLGLAICRRIAGAHGGRIALEPAAGPGARLRVELPAPPAPAARRIAADPFQLARGGRPAPRGAGLGNGALP